MTLAPEQQADQLTIPAQRPGGQRTRRTRQAPERTTGRAVRTDEETTQPGSRSRGHRHRARRRFVVLRLIASGSVVAIMADSTATTLAIPLLGHDPMTAGLPLAEITWVSTGNFAAVAALLATAGRFADLLGRRGVLALGLVLYGLGATAVILAPSWPVLVGGRLAEGVGAAMMFPASLGLLLGELPPARRAGAVALWSASSGIGALALQGGGGWLIEAYGWRGLYLPSAALAAMLLILTPALPRSRGANRRVPDLLGALLLVMAIAATVLAVSQGGVWGWTSLETLGCAGIAVIAMGLALATSWRHKAGAIDMGLWRRPGFLWGGGASCLYGAVSFIVLATGPLYLRESGFDAARIGWWLTPISVAMIVSSPLATLAGRRISINGVVYTGALTLGAGCALLLAQPSPTGWSLLGAVLLGTGFGFLSTGTFTTGTMAAEPSQYAAAVGAINTARMLGGAIGVAGASVLIENPFLPGPGPGFASVLAVCLAITVLLGTVALIRVARGKGRSPAPEEEDEVAMLRRLLAELRASFVQVRSEAENELARFGIHDPSGARARWSPGMAGQHPSDQR
ncbi:MFS transporter [Nonomuraea sp. NBC_01738]|uniref:MFS transporter n=1 Tax=Nonomuraea sp. NBC_01738 TaxID=2976003 RepID=UPI002E157215|nr:MFS transporter [Nonomuraea sp. NBC_01738]